MIYVYIAHRGLTNGPDKDLENNPTQIDKAISEGFHCEIDLWVLNNKTLMLGHDKPQYLIDYTFLYNKPLWIHAKNLEALNWLTTRRLLNFFWHENDTYTVTSGGYIWTYPGSKLTENSICNQPEWNTPIEKLSNFNENCFGVCSKYVGLMR